MDTPSPLSLTAGRLTAWLAMAVVCTRAVVDPDLWGHLRFGLDVLASGRLSALDPYSFTQDVAWINHEWLSEVIFGLAYRIGGVPGLVALKCAVVAAACAVTAVVVRPAEPTARWWLLAGAAVAAAPAAMTIRPQIWTILGIAFVCWALPRRERWVWLPPVFALWANMHGGWIVGVGVAGLWLAGRVLDTRGLRAVLPEAGALGAAVAATLANPYGWRLWAFLLATVRTSRDITEWRPLWQQDDWSNLLVWVVVTAGVVRTTVGRRRARISWAAALPIAWLAVMSLLVTRLLPIFGLVAVCNLAHAWQSGASVQPARPRPAGLALVDVSIVAVVCGFLLLEPSRCLRIEGPWTPDLDAASALASTTAAGRLVLPFDWGEYAIWHWGPRLRVSMDGRRETVYTDEMVRTQSAVSHGLGEGVAFLARTRPEYVWLPVATAAASRTWLESHGYRVDVETRRSFIATRGDLPALRPGPALSGCFP
ncbi:MAG: hypothetical protein ABUS56_09720 [Acidobacteriota bacterium]